MGQWKAYEPHLDLHGTAERLMFGKLVDEQHRSEALEGWSASRSAEDAVRGRGGPDRVAPEGRERQAGASKPEASSISFVATK